jgi:hypothetical protein
MWSEVVHVTSGRVSTLHGESPDRPGLGLPVKQAVEESAEHF